MSPTAVAKDGRVPTMSIRSGARTGGARTATSHSDGAIDGARPVRQSSASPIEAGGLSSSTRQTLFCTTTANPAIRRLSSGNLPNRSGQPPHDDGTRQRAAFGQSDRIELEGLECLRL